jgi:hypothetical protein
MTMSRLQLLKAELQKLSPVELRETCDWLDDFVEGSPEFTSGFQDAIRQSESEMVSSLTSRSKPSESNNQYNKYHGSRQKAQNNGLH